MCLQTVTHPTSNHLIATRPADPENHILEPKITTLYVILHTTEAMTV